MSRSDEAGRGGGDGNEESASFDNENENECPSGKRRKVSENAASDCVVKDKNLNRELHVNNKHYK
jgi:hypothetical protein